LVESLASRDEVSSIEEDGFVYIDDPVTVNSEVGQDPGTLAEWGITKIQAEQAWAVAGTGTGAVIGVIDTGARPSHEAIRAGYRGGTHSWYDPARKSATPGDGHGHGTHVTGTIAGSNGIGVAPGAKWISCKGLQDNGGGSFADIVECGQFMACPHTFDGQQPDCSLVPHAVSNSWSAGSANNFFDGVIQAWHAANIIPIFSQGNGGSSCQTGRSPADSVAGTIAVGSTTNVDAISTFSSRGPSYQGHQKPDVSAPGENVRSAGHLSDTAYASMSGTSMACPHVAGLVALIKSRKPDAKFADIKRILETSSDRNLVFDGQVCATVPDNQFPNYKYGHGRINALKAVQVTLAL
jgi:subtilisin family serine protease